MRFFRIALVVALITFYDVSSKTVDSCIIGGNSAIEGQFQYQVSLTNPQRIHFCGGSIISSSYVLTAAKCVDGKNPTDVLVLAGTNNLNSTILPFAASQLIIHGSFDSFLLQSNIALVRTSDNLLSIPKTDTIALNTVPANPGQRSTLTGWGRYSSSIPAYSNILRWGDFDVMSLSECQYALPEHSITRSNLCTRPSNSGGCDGDIGGPLVSFNMQIGILSWDMSCAMGKPDVYTDVATYYNWISQNIRLDTL